MTFFTPYNGSLMRLAFTLVAIMALFAAGFSYLQESQAADRLPAEPLRMGTVAASTAP